MKTRFLYIIALGVLVLDQVTKHLVEKHLAQETSVPIIGRILFFTAVHNRGGAFGMLQSWTGMLTVISLFVVAVILLFARSRGLLPRMIGLGLALQLGGALGNLVDRVRYGYVVDFIDLKFWPVFNIADAAITLGIALLAYYLLFCEGRGNAEAGA